MLQMLFLLIALMTTILMLNVVLIIKYAARPVKLCSAMSTKVSSLERKLQMFTLITITTADHDKKWG